MDTEADDKSERLDSFDEMAQACIANHDAVMRLGTPDMQTASKLLLFSLGEELAKREKSNSLANEA